MRNQIRKLRRELELTQQEFADKIGMKRNTVANYETGRNDPSASVISLICREFHVNENWLRTGDGEMFEPDPVGAIDALAKEHNLTSGERILIERFLNLKAEERQVFIRYIKEVSELMLRSDLADIPSTPEELKAIYPPVGAEDTEDKVG